MAFKKYFIYHFLCLIEVVQESKSGFTIFLYNSKELFIHSMTISSVTRKNNFKICFQ